MVPNLNTCFFSGRVSALNLHRPEKKKRKKLMKDSIHLANMLRRFTREKEEIRKKNVVAAGLPRPPTAAAAATTKVPIPSGAALLAAHPKVPGGGECHMTDLSADPAVMSLLGAANNDLLQDMMGDLDFAMLDSPQPSSPVQGENGLLGAGHKAGGGRLPQGNMISPPPLPGGLPGPLAKRIEDLRAVGAAGALHHVVLNIRTNASLAQGSATAYDIPICQYWRGWGPHPPQCCSIAI